MSTAIRSDPVATGTAIHTYADDQLTGSFRTPIVLYAIVVLFTCIWVLSLPVFPSQDEPLHLYYVHIFNQLLNHEQTIYTSTYFIRHFFPPYATYYYFLIGFGHLVGLENADKLFVCACILLFAVTGWVLVRTVSPQSQWAPFLLLPVLLNWPTFMGFANYMLSVDLSCLALAVWWKGKDRPSRGYSVLFLLLIVGMVFTHPIPWLFTMGFTGLEVGIRCARAWNSRATNSVPWLSRDVGTVVLACLPYLYLERFRVKTQVISRRAFDETSGTWKSIPDPSLLQRLHGQYFSLLHTHGLVLFLGSGWPHLYRLAIGFLLYGALLLTLWSIWVRGLPVAWKEQHVWALYAVLLVFALILVPDEFGGGYFFVKRMQILLYICVVVSASEVLRQNPTLAVGAAIYSVAVSFFTLLLASWYITPVARSIVSLRELPTPPASTQPGLLIRPVGVAFPPHLNFDSYNWAPVDYFRWHQILLFNTAWLGEPLVPIGPRPQVLPLLDGSYFNQAPQFGDRLMTDEHTAKQLFSRVGFVLVQRTCVKQSQNIFAEVGGRAQPGDFSHGWQCHSTSTGEWSLCRPSDR